MVISLIDSIGWLAVVLSQVFYVPNTIRILRTRDVRGYSLAAWLMLSAGLACYLVYFIAHGDPVGIVANIFGVSGASLTTACVWRWRNVTPRPAAVVPGPNTAPGGGQ